MTKNKLKPYAYFLVFLLATGLANAQESVNTSGRDATGSGGSAAYSVGQIVYTATNSIAGSIGQGVQQPFEIFNLETQDIPNTISIFAYPNPSTEKLLLQFNAYKNEKFFYKLIDLQGNILVKGEIKGQETPISTENLASSTYFITITSQENRMIKSIKIIKH